MPRPYRIVLFAVAILLGVAAAVLAAQPLLTLFGGFLFALALHGVADALARTLRIRYGVCLAATLLVLVGVTVLGIVELGPTLREQLRDLATRLPAAAHALQARIRELTAGAPPAAPDSSPDDGMLARGAATLLGATAEVGGGMVVVFFVGVYGAARPADYTKAALAVTPEAYRPRMRILLEEVSANLTRWLLGRLVAMVFVGVACSTAFSCLHVPLALVLGVFAGLLTFVEYAGAIVSAVPPVLLAVTRSPATVVAVLAVYACLHVIEGYVLTPLLARASARLPPALTLAGQVLFAALVGVLGLTFSTPLLVVGVVAVRTWRKGGRGSMTDE
jgi:predicted PurR-regulated permease PerM